MHGRFNSILIDDSILKLHRVSYNKKICDSHFFIFFFQSDQIFRVCSILSFTFVFVIFHHRHLKNIKLDLVQIKESICKILHISISMHL